MSKGISVRAFLLSSRDDLVGVVKLFHLFRTITVVTCTFIFRFWCPHLWDTASSAEEVIRLQAPYGITLNSLVHVPPTRTLFFDVLSYGHHGSIPTRLFNVRSTHASTDAYEDVQVKSWRAGLGFPPIDLCISQGQVEDLSSLLSVW